MTVPPSRQIQSTSAPRQPLGVEVPLRQSTCLVGTNEQVAALEGFSEPPTRESATACWVCMACTDGMDSTAKQCVKNVDLTWWPHPKKLFQLLFVGVRKDRLRTMASPRPSSLIVPGRTTETREFLRAADEIEVPSSPDQKPQPVALCCVLARAQFSLHALID